MANHLRDFTLSDPIFTDTNIFVYQQGAHPDFGPDCRDFLDKVEHGDVQAVTTDVVINEVIYIIQIQRAANLLRTLILRFAQDSVIHTRMAADVVLADECWFAVE